MKNAVFWDIKPSPYLTGDTYSLQNLAGLFYVRFEVFRAVIMNNAVFWDINTHFLPHRKHYVSTAEPSRLMLCKI
jgi:hypothetical protein